MSEVVRGRGGDSLQTRRIGKRGGQFDSLRPLTGQKPGDFAKSIEGWVLFVSGLPQETVEGDLVDAFAQFGTLRNIRITLDQRELRCAGHAMVEFESALECENAIKALSGGPFLSSPAIYVGPAFLVEDEEPTEPDADDDDGKRHREE